MLFSCNAVDAHLPINNGRRISLPRGRHKNISGICRDGSIANSAQEPRQEPLFTAPPVTGSAPRSCVPHGSSTIMLFQITKEVQQCQTCVVRQLSGFLQRSAEWSLRTINLAISPYGRGQRTGPGNGPAGIDQQNQSIDQLSSIHTCVCPKSVFSKSCLFVPVDRVAIHSNCG